RIGRRDSHAWSRSAVVAVPAAAGVEERARPVPRDHEQRGDPHEARAAEEGSGRRADGRRRRTGRGRKHRAFPAGVALDNYERAKKNAQFVSIELDRMESKIQALAEMAVNRQDPDLISSQVDSAAESMRQTEKAVSELQHLTALADELQDPPPILDADLRQVLRHDS